MDNNPIPTTPPRSACKSSVETRQTKYLGLNGSNIQNTTKNINQAQKSNKYPVTKLDEPFRIRHRFFLRISAIVCFVVIVTIVGVITVCLTSSKRTNPTCQFNFERSAKQIQDEYDSRPYYIGVGDFNKDNHLDMVVANSGTDNIGVFLNYQNGTFAPQVTYSTAVGSRPYSVAVGDVNNDTHLDIAVANYATNSIGTILGYGNGSFASPIVTSLGPSRPLSLAVGYLNNDHVLDIAVANYGTATIAVLFGYNNGSFRIDNVYEMGYDSNPYALALASLNQDNTIDIVAVNYGTSELVLLFNNGNGRFFMEKYWTEDGSQPTSVTTGDFNDDTKLDIAVAYSSSSNIGIFLGNGNGSFTKPMMYSLGAGSQPQFIDVGDFNNDTHLDIALVDSESDNVVVLLGNGNGNFLIVMRHSTGYNSNPSSMIVGDFDNDQKLDVAVTNNGTNTVLVLTSYLTYPTTYSIGYNTEDNSRPYSIDVGDFNEDHYLDIIASYNNTNSVGVFLNLGNETFTNEQTSMGLSSSPSFVVTGDVNNDHHLDAIVALKNINSIGILVGYGDGTFTQGNRFSTGSYSNPSVLATGDLDNDSNLDVVTVNSGTGNLGVFFGFGNGTFTDATLLLIPNYFYPNFVGIGDVNNDRILDIVTSNGGYAGGIAILLGYDNRSFHDPIFFAVDGDNPNTFIMGDLNNDHRLDIIYTSTICACTGVLLGNGDGTFGTVTRYLTVHGSLPWSVALGYYNNDTFLDMAVSNTFDSSLNIYLGIGNGSFETPTRLSTGNFSNPMSVMFGDFNNNHQQDIVVANDIIDTIEIFFVYYDADFTIPTSYSTGSGSHPVSVSVGDFNSDGESDVLVANSGNDDIEVLLHYNNGIFINTTIFSVGLGSHPQCVTIADFNGDHLLDIAVVYLWTNNMNVFVGLGNASFDARIDYSTGSQSAPNSIAAGDLNNDGRMDVVIANQGTDDVVVFLAFDYVSFTSHVVDVPGYLPTPYYVATGDFNNDHLMDIAVVNINSYTLGIYLGYGDGTFSEQITYSTGPLSSPKSLAVGDFNNDSYLDIVVANSNTSNICVFLGYGNGSFQSQISYSTGDSSQPCSVAIADFNNDRQLDIAVADNNNNSNSVWVFLGYGNGSFSGQIVYSMVIQSSPMWIAVNDLNDDTIPDIVVANYLADNVCILFGYGNGSFGNVVTLLTGLHYRPVSVALGDFNRDKLIDIAVASQQYVGLFFGFGNGTFSSEKIYSAGPNSKLHSITVGDINNDTLLDILVADYDQLNSSIAIFYGFGDGNFTLPTIYSTGLNSWPYSIATADFNNDGKVDLAVNYWNEDSIGIFIQMKNEPFASSESFSTDTQSQPKSVTLGDFNNDNYLDIAVANSYTNNIGILLGYGDGRFADQLTYSTSTDSLPSSISVGHFNDDHYLDIAVVNAASNNVGIFIGYGNGTFASMTVYSTGISSVPVAIAVNDMNRDNYLDLVIANSGTNEVLIFLGKGNGSFSEPKIYSIGYNARPQSVAIGDINNDHMLDIVVANNGTNYVEILLQTC